ncbi:subtilisin-like protein [Lactarius akahatsu]|uniref:Subtilisin-like protein n=1 Tax=Lactarius akahatsu TaxID=416441 RepID=A0AAD4Q8V5_9AGAM|nr:subtilisin-like protein [Lactarius akahatsu]
MAICSIALATPSHCANHVVHKRRTVEPIGWVQSHRAHADDTITLRIGMKQQNLHMIENLLMDVAHPDPPTYGQHWTPKKVVDFFAPSESTVSSIRTWLSASGIAEDKPRLSPNKGWIELDLTVATAERLLGTEYHIYEHPSGERQIGCLSYSVPEHISDHVGVIKPTVHLNYRLPEYPARLRRRANLNHLGQPSITHVPRALANGAKIDATLSLTNCDQFVTLECLRALYDFCYIPGATEKNSYGIESPLTCPSVEFTPQTYRSPDLDLFFKKFSSTQIGQRPTLVSIDGCKSPNSSVNSESDLDLEYAMVLTNPQPVTLLQTGDIVEEPESCGIIQPPYVVSVSYAQDEGTATHRYATRQCNGYGKLGLLGTTVLYGSGDDGVAGGGGVCQNSSGDNDVNAVRFNPAFPASCSFVVSVGATQINSGATVNDPESAYFFSGGGYSDIFPMPSYQATTVAKFLKEHPPPYNAAQFNNSGKARGFPDLSANGLNYTIALDGRFKLVSGTSASSPVVGKRPFAHAFNDITAGKNPGCGIVRGWDPVTGLGTPNFEKLLHLFLELP